MNTNRSDNIGAQLELNRFSKRERDRERERVLNEEKLGEVYYNQT